jgi:hypothetical protein
MRTILRPIVPLVCVGVTATGCLREASPHQGQFTVDFPSTAAAIQTDSLEVYVFASSDATATTFCHELVSARAAQNTWSVQPLSTTTFPPCSVVTAPGSVSLPVADFGDRAIVIVGRASGKDLLIGCQRVTLGEGDLPIPIPLSLIGTTPVAPTTCTTVHDHCEGKC